MDEIDNVHVRASGTNNSHRPFAIMPRTNPWKAIPTHILSSGAPVASQVRLYHDEHRGTSQPHKTEGMRSVSLPTESDTDLPHLTPSQNVHMTKISQKPVTERSATATCYVHFSNDRPWELLREGRGTRKGDVFSVARIAGIMAAKKTPDIIPLCHPGIGITGVEVDVQLVDPASAGKINGAMKYGAMHVMATVSCLGRTGVEMEAMTATMGAALTVYDMLKAVDKGMVVGGVQLLEKKGGKSGHWVREKEVSDDV